MSTTGTKADKKTLKKQKIHAKKHFSSFFFFFVLKKVYLCTKFQNKHKIK